ncbi:MAG: PD-(D/E)XK nuclease family protein [Armatimonadota bacterium]
MTTSTLLTYTQLQSFRNCRRACQWRYERELVPHATHQALNLGSLVHRALQRWHEHADLALVLRVIDEACPARDHDEAQRQSWQLARAMLCGYAARYPAESFHVLALEAPFEMPIRNPASGRASRRYRLAGKVDGIVEEDGQYYLLEHKTTSHLDGDYLERLWMDMQICLYSRALERIHGIAIAGVIYNILCKAQLKQGKGETEDEFFARKAELLAKSKTGKSSAQRKLSESDDVFHQRLLARYGDPAMFHREVILFTPDQYAELEAEVWELTRQYRDAQRRAAFYRNTAQCFAYGRPCAYYPLCRANGAEHLIALLYEQRPPHDELREASPDELALVF